MTVSALQSVTSVEPAMQLLEEHHLVVVHENPGARMSFASALHDSLQLIPGSRVVHIAPPDAAPPNNADRLISLIKSNEPGMRRLFAIWHDADALLRADRMAFSRLVNTCFAIAAHAEHLSLDPLVLRRLICIGGPELAEYANDARGQFRAWLDDGEEHETPFWDVISIVPKPPVAVLRIE